MHLPQTSTSRWPADESERTAREINGLIELGMLPTANAILNASDKHEPNILRAAKNYYFAVEDWTSLAAVGGQLLKTQGQQTWNATYDAALALHNLGKSGEALELLNTFEPGGSRSSWCHHHYSRSCYLAAVGRYREAFLELCAAHAATGNYWCKAFVDSDLRAMWQWLGDVHMPDADLVAALSDDLWSDVIKRALSEKTDFCLDSRDLSLHPKLRQNVRYDNATATFFPKFTQTRALKSWFQSRSRWAVRCLRRAIHQTLQQHRRNPMLIQP